MEYLLFLLFVLMIIWGMHVLINYESKISYNDYVKNYKYDPKKTYSTDGKPLMSFDEFKHKIINFDGGMP